MTDLLPPHDDVSLALEDIGAALGAAEVHGLLAGLACSGSALAEAKLRALLNVELDIELDEATWRDLRAIAQTARRQLADDNLGFELLLPEDDLPLADRVQAMAQWCVGFLAGFGNGTGGRPEQELPEDVRMLLGTMAEFTRAEIGEDDVGAGEEAAERDFVEIVEYLRIAALSIFLEMAKPRDGGPAPDTLVH